MKALPFLVKKTPVVLSSEFDVSKPFGHWNVVFKDSALRGVANPPSCGTSDLLRSKSSVRNPRRVFCSIPTPPLLAAMFSTAVVSKGRVFTCDGGIYTAGGCLKGGSMPIIRKPEQLEWHAIVVPLCDVWCVGYFHFTHENLVRLVLVHKTLVEQEDAVLVLNSEPRRFHGEWLTDVLGIPTSRILYKPPLVHGRVVLYPMPSMCGVVSLHMLSLMRAIVFERLGLVAPPPIVQRRIRLLFSERGRLSRMPMNYHSLKRMLIEEYQDVLSFNTTKNGLHVSEQVRVFYHADIVVGPHGANLANVIWMRHGTHVIEFLSYKDANMCYYTAAANANVTYHAVLHSAGKDDPYTLAYGDLKRHVDYAIESLQSTM